MKIIQSSIFRALCAIVVGVLILKYPQDGLTWLTMAVGELFLISGIISLIAYWFGRQHSSQYTITDQHGRIISNGQPTFPIVGCASIILGLVLIIAPEKFVNGLMYVLGAMMIIGGIQQLYNLLQARRIAYVHWLFWVCPSMILLTGVFAIVKPMETAATPLIILGWCSLLYGVTELINSLLFWRMRKHAERLAQKEDSSVAEEISSELNHPETEE